jgi:hypothetical protein
MLQSVSGESFRYGKGQVVDVSDKTAREWISLGMAEPDEDTKVVEIPDTPIEEVVEIHPEMEQVVQHPAENAKQKRKVTQVKPVKKR